MASLNPTKTVFYYSAKNMEYRSSVYDNYSYENSDAIKNTINYVTRSGNRRDQASDLVCYGAAGVYYGLKPKDYIKLFTAVQETCRIDREIKTKIVHEILSFNSEEESFLLSNQGMIFPFAMACSDIYLRSGHLCVFGVHYGYNEERQDGTGTAVHPKKLHIHFIVNAVNHETGNMFDSKISSKPFLTEKGTKFRIPFGTKSREREMNGILYSLFIQMPNPFHCQDDRDYFCNAYQEYNR